MNKILKGIGNFLWQVLKELDWKKVVYNLCKGIITDKIRKKILDSESKWDDAGLKAFDLLVEMFLKPEAKK